MFTFTFMHLSDTFIQSDLQCIQAILLLSVCVPWDVPWRYEDIFFNICAFSCHRRHAFISDPLPVIRVPTRRRYGNVTGGHAQPTAEHRGGHTQKRSPPDEEQVHTHLSHVLQLMHQCACSHLTFYLHVAGRRRASVAKKRKNMLSAWRIASLCWKTRTRLS